MSDVTIRPISAKADRRKFVDLPFRLYADDPNWVPPLKSEALGLAVMTELPLVVVDVQRGGPSTGLPTKTEQSDLSQAGIGVGGYRNIGFFQQRQIVG